MRSDVQEWIDEWRELPKKERKKTGLGDFIRDKIETVVDGDKYVLRSEGEEPKSNHILQVIMDDIDSYDHGTAS